MSKRTPSGVSRTILLAVLATMTAVAAIGIAALYWLLSGDGVRLALERQATAWLGQPVRIGSATAALFPRVAIRLRDVRVGDGMPLTLAQVDLSTGLVPLLSRRIEDADVLVSDGRVEMPLPFGLPAMTAADVPVATAPAAALAAGVELVSIRAIALRDLVIASRGREITLAADSALTGTRLSIESLTVAAGDTVLEARGTVELAPQVVATIEATASEVDVDDLLTLAGAFTGGAASSRVQREPAQITASITAPRGQLAGIPVGRVEADVLADGTDVRIEPLQFDIFGGRFDGWLDVTFGDALDVRVGAGVSNVDVAQLVAFGGSAGAMTGRLFGTGRFGARGADMGSVLAATRGVGEVTVSDGTIRNLQIVRTVLGFFGGQSAAPASAEGAPFESITATFALADQVVRSDDLTLRSADFDVFARGTLALPSTALDARADLVLSEDLSKQAGRDVYRYTQAGGRVVLPAVVEETLADPRVRIDAGAAVRRGLRNEIERRLEDLLERVKPSLE